MSEPNKAFLLADSLASWVHTHVAEEERDEFVSQMLAEISSDTDYVWDNVHWRDRYRSFLERKYPAQQRFYSNERRV